MTMCVELGELAQGFGDSKGTETTGFLKLEEIKMIPTNQTVRYVQINIDYRPQKKYG